jgi:hypothetical protein
MRGPVKIHLILCLVSILAAWAATVSDILLLYVPNANFLSGDFSFLASVPVDRAEAGLLLGLITIPLVGIGVFALIPLIHNNKMLISGMVVSTLAIIGSGLFCHFSFLIFILESNETPPDGDLFMGQLNFSCLLMGILFFVSFAGLAILILTEKIKAPKWLITFTPIVTFPILAGIGWAIPVIGQFLVPTLFNLTAGIFYCALFVVLRSVNDQAEANFNE